MSMSNYACFSDCIDEEFVKSICPDEYAILIQEANKEDYGLEYYADDISYSNDCENEAVSKAFEYLCKEKITMNTTEALQLIEKNEGVPALNYAINYVHYALQLDQTTKEFKVQLLYVLNNMSRWRQSKASTTTAAEIKECRAVLKKASG